MISRNTEVEVSTRYLQRRYVRQRKICKKNSRFEPPFGGHNAQVHIWLDGKRVVDFLLVTTELFSLALTAEALSSEIC